MDEELDLSAYLTLPNSSARVLVALGRMLLRSMPDDLTPTIERAGKLLEQEIEELMDGLRARRDAEGGQAIAEEDLDFATDGLWKMFSDRLEQWQVFERPAFARFASDEVVQAQFDYQSRIDKAERARFLRNYLFGGLGTDFTRMPYLVQSEFIATIWTLIDQERLEEEYASFVGADFLATLRDAHRRYLVMLKDRHKRSKNQRSTFNLNERRARLHRRLMMYVAAVVVMTDEEDDKSLQATQIALEPIDMLRELGESLDGSIAHEGDEELEVDQLVAEIEAINAELGVRTGDAFDLALSEVSASGSFRKLV